MRDTLEASWRHYLSEETSKPYFSEMEKFIAEERIRYAVFPSTELVFSAFAKSPFAKTRVVLVGQDPYHSPDQAMGLSFSIPKGQRIPPSLKNIYKELESDLGHSPASHGDLTAWAEQGILLLNSILTVRRGEAASHRNIGWEKFTAAAIARLSEHRQNIVFLLWGKHAQKLKQHIDTERHLILRAAHPSPLARGAFFGSRPFSQTDDYLAANDLEAINWDLH